MQAGKLRFRLELQRPVEMRDDIGGFRQDWQTFDTVWGDIKPLRGKELETAQKIENRSSHKIILRYYPDFSPKWRIRKEGTSRTFQLVDDHNIHERNREMDISAWEIDG